MAQRHSWHTKEVPKCQPKLHFSSQRGTQIIASSYQSFFIMDIKSFAISVLQYDFRNLTRTPWHCLPSHTNAESRNGHQIFCHISSCNITSEIWFTLLGIIYHLIQMQRAETRSSIAHLDFYGAWSIRVFSSTDRVAPRFWITEN